MLPVLFARVGTFVLDMPNLLVITTFGKLIPVDTILLKLLFTVTNAERRSSPVPSLALDPTFTFAKPAVVIVIVAL
jgi:cytochrome c-type biogenesis protein CcmH/NrfF